LADAAEHRHTAVLQRDVVNQLHDDDGLADAGAAEQTDLSALQVGLEEVDDLDACLEHPELGRLILEVGRRAMNRQALLRRHRPVWKIDRLAEHVQHAAERLGPDRHGDRAAEIEGLHAALQTVGGLHRDRADAVLAEVLLDFRHDIDRAGGRALRFDAERVVDFRQVSRLELDVDDGTDDLDDGAYLLLHLCSHSSIRVWDWGCGMRDSLRPAVTLPRATKHEDATAA